MKKLKPNGRVILSSTLAIVLFALMVVWFDKPGKVLAADEKTALVQRLAQHNSKLPDVLQHAPPEGPLMVVGILPSGLPWNFLRASYPDPVALNAQFGAIQRLYSGRVTAIRFRSTDEFLQALERQEQTDPGFLEKLNTRELVLMKEDPFAISLKLIFAVVYVFVSVGYVLTMRPKS